MCAAKTHVLFASNNGRESGYEISEPEILSVGVATRGRAKTLTSAMTQGGHCRPAIRSPNFNETLDRRAIAPTSDLAHK
jgi:hypothetical protein